MTAVAVGAFGYDVCGVGNILRVAYYRLLGIAYVAGKTIFSVSPFSVTFIVMLDEPKR